MTVTLVCSMGRTPEGPPAPMGPTAAPMVKYQTDSKIQTRYSLYMEVPSVGSNQVVIKARCREVPLDLGEILQDHSRRQNMRKSS